VSGADGWSSVPVHDPASPDGHGREARPTPGTPAAGSAHGPVHGTPAPQYGEYAPEGWVNPVLVEQERQEQQRREREREREQEQRGWEARRPADATRSAGPAGPRDAGGRSAPASGRFGASPLDFVLTVGLLVVGLWVVIESLAVQSQATTIRTVVEQQYTELSDPAALSSAVLVRAGVLVVLFVLVAWWSIRRLRSRRWTFWVPLVGGVVATVLGMVPVMVVIFQDPQFAAYMQRMTGG